MMARTPETKVKFSVFNKEFNEALREMGDESKQLKKEFQLQAEQMRDTASETEKLEAKVRYLGKQQEIANRKIRATEEQLEKAKRMYGENSNEANKLANQLLDLRISEQRMRNSISDTNRQLAEQAQEMDGTRRRAERLRSAMRELAEDAEDAGEKMTSGVTVPMAGAGIAAGASAMNVKDAARLMIGSLGATGKEAEQLEKDMRTVWSDGFGEGPEDVARSIMMVKQNIRGINDGAELQDVTKKMLMLANATESDLGEATRGVNQIMHNFGKTAGEAMDLFKKGQEAGLNFSDEMFDNISEYAPKFKAMGYSAEEYFELLVQGAKNGAYNLDYVNDAVKTFDDNLNSGSDSVSDAFDNLSDESQSLFKEFEKGGSSTKEVLKSVLKDLEGMENQTKANEIGAELIGSKFEDMGSEAVYALKDVNNSMDDVEGSMDRFVDSQEEAFGRDLRSTLRKLQEAIIPIGEELLEIAEDVIPHIQDLAERFADMDEETQKFILTLGGMAAAAGPAITIFSKLNGLVGGLATGFGSAGAAAGARGFGGTLMKVVSKAGPIGLGIAAFGGLGFAVSQLIDKEKELNDVSLEKANTMMKEYESTEKMITQFDQLRGKSKLTNKEFARYVDLQAELDTASSTGEVEAIKKEMAKLQGKSHLSNKELKTMVGLNTELAENIPGATEKITDQGQKLVGTTSELRRYNQEAREAAMLEMKEEFYEAAENYNQLLKDRKLQQQALNGFKIREQEINNYLQNYTQSELESLAQKVKKEKDSLQARAASAELGSEERANLTDQAHKRRQLYLLIKDGKQGLTEQLNTVNQQIVEQEKKINNTDVEISKMNQVYKKLQLQHLIGAGIEDQAARKAIQEENTIGLLDQQLGKLEQQRRKLNEQYPPNQRNSEEYQEQINKIDGQIGRMREAKGKIQDLGREAYNYTQELGKDVYKNVNAKLTPSAASINSSLSATVNKTVRANMVPGTSNFHAPMYADGTDYHPGGPAIVGEEGVELAREGNKWSLYGYGYVPNLARGADVFTHDETMKILSGLNSMPAYAGGAGDHINISKRLTQMSSNMATKQQGIINNQLRLSIESTDILMDGVAVGKATWKTVQEQTRRAEETTGRFGG
ncbi:phage tail tape measure protein [Pontibacillus salipaludis]|uniref:Phage tail tape measure protein domain-containing protein n=1 Tax=Pontibacillus salipaludis TaxID=1697394 RepID=A0ABQ1PVW7_9BACI|nr:phage tail tape measure protein [Pontibacillus salipaludis]GGD05439.1 hypothetical protein GCM10011389_11190 [Pontibacillus salipaludis]